MPYRKQQFVTNGVYHTILRGIDDNLIFKNLDDYYRGIFSIYEFNNNKPVEIWLRRKQRKKEKTLGDRVSQSRERLIDILAFCFMPNHIHLLLKQTKENGITKFMQKVGVGYGGYFNRKYKRKGYVFQNRFSDVLIKDDKQLMAIFAYIHTNPISLIEPNWKEIGIKNPEEVIEFLESYKWSSYQDYVGRENFTSVTDREFISGLIGGAGGCREFIKNWIEYKREISKYPNLFLE